MGFGDKLKSAIDKIKNSLHVDKDLIKEVIKDIQRALISSDVNVQLVLKISKEIETEAFEKIPEGLSRKEHLVKTCYDVIVKYIGGREVVKLPENPESILLCGLFGSGKTTTTAKLAKFYKKRGLKVGVIAADVYRPAAYEQLEQLSKQVDCLFYGEKETKSAKQVAENGLSYLKKKGANIIIVDSAGRSSLDKELLKELKDIFSVINPKYSFLVLSADIGQAAKDQAENFNQSIGVNGVIITKLDGSAKGGGALTACYITNSPIYFIGTGEKVDDLEVFDANRYLSRILGFGDLEGLLEKVKELQESEDLEDLNPEDILKGDFTFALFKKQINAAKKLGPLTKIINMLGVGGNLSKDQLNLGQEKMKKYKVILDSFTHKELNFEPTEITKSRIKRISNGSGTKEEDVKELLSHVKKMKKMFKQFGARGGSSQNMMKKMFGGKIPDMSKFDDMDPKQMQEMAKKFK
jgi:signal recognition particle subunit SRP54